MPKTIPTVVVASDLHLGEHSVLSINTLFAVVAQIKPSQIVLNGDILDCTELHKSTRGLRVAPRTGRSSLQVGEEIILAKLFLSTLRSIAPKGCKIIYTEGNHESRYPRTLATSCPEMYSTIPQLPDVLGLATLDIQWVPENQIYTGVPNWRITHGSRCSSNAAKLDGISGQGSFLQGHTHRLSQSGQTDPATGVTRWFVEGGHLRDPRASYTRYQTPDWQGGLVLLTECTKGNYTPTLIPFAPDGSCVVGQRVISPNETPVPGIWQQAARAITTERKRQIDRAVNGKLWAAK